jgi:hypothetical protein
MFEHRIAVHHEAHEVDDSVSRREDSGVERALHANFFQKPVDNSQARLPASEKYLRSQSRDVTSSVYGASL